MLSFPKTLLLLILCGASVGLPAQSITPSQPSAPANTPAAPIDPFGRATPSDAVLGFLKAATAGDNSIAAQYLQMKPAQRQAEGEQMAVKLKFVLDNVFIGNYSRFTQPEGTPQEGVPLGRQKMGTMSAGDVEMDFDVVRVTDPSAGKIWLISGDTLAKLANEALAEDRAGRTRPLDELL